MPETSNAGSPATPGKLLYPWFVAGALLGGLLLVPIALTILAQVIPILEALSIGARVAVGLASFGLILVAFTTECGFRPNLGGFTVVAAGLAPQLYFKEGGAVVSLCGIALLLLTAAVAFAALMAGRSHLLKTGKLVDVTQSKAG